MVASAFPFVAIIVLRSAISYNFVCPALMTSLIDWLLVLLSIVINSGPFGVVLSGTEICIRELD
ncbi:hypothetical protein [Bacillus luti]|uniref:hypothetical protein n=1 Tax=Bacillus luti TaxID=2026191 RepID=UPI00124C9647|nr:hypothetical protein [Bacillus luti]